MTLENIRQLYENIKLILFYRARLISCRILQIYVYIQIHFMWQDIKKKNVITFLCSALKVINDTVLNECK